MSDETKKELLKLMDDSYKQGGIDMRDSLVEALRVTVKLLPNMTAHEVIDAIQRFDYNKIPIRSN